MDISTRVDYRNDEALNTQIGVCYVNGYRRIYWRIAWRPNLVSDGMLVCLLYSKVSNFNVIIRFKKI